MCQSYSPLVTTPPEENGADPGKSGYGPVLWKACVKFGLYMAVGAEPEALEIPIPFIPVEDSILAFVILKIQ